MIEYLVCCFHKFSAILIQYFLFGLLSIVISFSVSGFFIIDWAETKNNSRLVFGLGITVLIITYVILIIIIILRARNTLNYKYYRFGLGLSYYALIISFIGLFLSIIAFLWGAFQFFGVKHIEKGELVKQIKTTHKAGVRAVKKIYHSKFGECLITSAHDSTIKLWYI